jgi:hypothetical protein
VGGRSPWSSGNVTQCGGVVVKPIDVPVVVSKNSWTTYNHFVKEIFCI